MNSPATDPLTMAYHELRAPLALVVTAARSAAGEAQEGELRLRCEMIVRAAERMLRTASEMCGLEGPQEPGSEAAFQPAEIVDDIVVTMRGLDVRSVVASNHQRMIGQAARGAAILT